MYNGGQLGIYTPSQNRNVWATGIVNGGISKDSLQIGESLLPNQAIWSNNRQFRLIYQQDSNLVLYRNKDNAALWASGTAGQSAGRFEMKNDGVMALYSPDNTMVWASRFSNNPVIGYQLQLADTGTANIVSADGTVIISINKLANVTPRAENFIAFKHTVTAQNVDTSNPNITILDHPQLNGNPTALLFVSPVWGDEKGGVENVITFGVWYKDGRWMIFNQDKAVAMVLHASYHVMATTIENPHVFVHTASAANLSMNRTYINHPASHKRPNALLMVTQHFGELNNREIGVAYEYSNDNWFIFNKVEAGGDSYNEDLNGIPLYAKFNVLVVEDNNVTGIKAFNHQVNAGNIFQGSHISFMDNQAVNNKSNSLLFFTESWLSRLNGQPIQVGGVANRSASYLWYDDPRDQYKDKDGFWSIDNVSGQPMQPSRMFNMFVLEDPSSLLPIPVTIYAENLTFVSYRHVVGASLSSTSNATPLNHPLLNNNPNAIVFANSNYGYRTEGLDNGNLFGVRYNGTRWEIASQSGLANTMHPAFTFNVLIAPQNCPNVFTHVVTKQSLQMMNRTYLDHPLVNGQPNVHIMVTQNLTDGKPTQHEIGVAYDNGNGRWLIYNNVKSTDESYDSLNHGIPEGAKFNILVLSGAEQSNIEVISHKTFAKNIILNVSFLSHPLLDHNRDSMMFTTPAWLPVLGGNYNPSMIALWYDDDLDGWKYKNGFWSVYNSVAGVPIAHGTVFNIFIIK